MGSFEAALEWGKEAEEWVADFLMARGWLILPTYDFSGDGENKAPKLMALDSSRSLVIPDLLGARNGTVRWFEVKRKTHADWTHITQRIETGVNLRLLNHYRKVRDSTGMEVWIIFVHDSEDEVLGANIDAFDNPDVSREYTGRKMGRGGMAFIAVSALRHITTISEIRATRDRAKQTSGSSVRFGRE